MRHLYKRHENTSTCQHLVVMLYYELVINWVLDSFGESVDTHLHSISLLESLTFLNFVRVLIPTAVVAHCIIWIIRSTLISLPLIVDNPDPDIFIRSTDDFQFEFEWCVFDNWYIENKLCAIILPVYFNLNPLNLKWLL